MRKFLLLSIVLQVAIFSTNAQQKKQTSKPSNPTSKEVKEISPSEKKASTDSSFTVTLKTPSYKAGIAYLCYHMGKNLNIEDAAAVSNQGIAIFKGNRFLPGGIYAIVFPGKNLTFDFFIDKEQNITILADSADLQNVIVQGSPENDLFKEYQGYVGIKGGQMQQERNAYTTSKTAQDSTLHQDNYTRLNKELNDYRDGIIKNHPTSMMTTCLNAMKEPEILNKKPLTRQDSLDNYNYYKLHYWDGVTFMDSRVLRTPFFLPKLERYYREVLPQAPDSIIKDLDYKLLLARSSTEMFKFLLNWFTDEYINPKYMGQDAIFVHLFEKYHSKGVSYWLNEKQMEAVSRRAYMQMSNLIGVTAANLEMVDTTGKPSNLFSLNAEYTLVIFWDPTCGHCKEEVPRIDSIYRATWKAKGVRIYSVLSDNDKKKEFVEYIKEHKIGDWTNVYETKEMEKIIADAKRPGFKQLYDVIQTPTLFLLDKEKRIIGKKLGFEQLNDFLKTKWSSKKD
jgi:thiol-disulfide isomerase/thioredoxin